MGSSSLPPSTSRKRGSCSVWGAVAAGTLEAYYLGLFRSGSISIAAGSLLDVSGGGYVSSTGVLQIMITEGCCPSMVESRMPGPVYQVSLTSMSASV